MLESSKASNPGILMSNGRHIQEIASKEKITPTRISGFEITPRSSFMSFSDSLPALLVSKLTVKTHFVRASQAKGAMKILKGIPINIQ